MILCKNIHLNIVKCFVKSVGGAVPLGMCGCRGFAGSDHVNAVIEEASKLFDRGYHVYLEQSFTIGEGLNAVVDIYAIKKEMELMVEVGSLTTSFTSKKNRLALLKKARPNCKILWVRQWSHFEVQPLK